MERQLRQHLAGGKFMDVSPEHSRLMSLIRSKDTKPELLVRRLVHSLGYRYRLHVKTLPGTPDLVFVSRQKIILVSGCFWHMHRCSKSHVPAKRRDFWAAKLNRNRERDAQTRRSLRRLGWRVLTLWECQTRNPHRVAEQVVKFLR